MYKHSKVYSCLWAVVLLAIPAVSCKHDNLLMPKPNEHVRPAADFIRNNYDFQLFYAALEYTGLTSALNGPGPFTILAVPDICFKNMGILDEGQVRRLNKDSLLSALSYHIIKNRRLHTSDIPTNGVDIRYETLNGKRLYTSAYTKGNVFYFDGALVTRSNIQLSNGVLHVLGKMMQYHQGKTVADYLSRLPEYSIFVAGLKKFGLWAELAGNGPFTIYAPTDDVFAQRGITMETITAMNPAAYYGNRLFGAYILYDKHFFVSDQSIYSPLVGQGLYRKELRNDNWYVQLSNLDMQPFPNDNVTMPYPQIALMKPYKPFFPIVIGAVTQRSDEVKPLIWYDQLCENGIVHRLHGLLALPNDVIK